MPSFLHPRALLRVEGAAGVLVALLLYGRTGGSWLVFIALFLVPDASMLGYLAGPRTGAAAYNVIHTYALAALGAGYGVVSGQPVAVSLALILFAHIATDRFLGFGLKYPSGFKETHLQRL